MIKDGALVDSGKAHNIYNWIEAKDESKKINIVEVLQEKDTEDGQGTMQKLDFGD